MISTMSSPSTGVVVAPRRRVCARRANAVTPRASAEKWSRAFDTHAVAGTAMATMVTMTLLTTPAAHAEVTCSMLTPCTPPPPNGEPRYNLPSTTYDPAKAATERYVAKLKAAEDAASTRAPATSASTSANDAN